MSPERGAPLHWQRMGAPPQVTQRNQEGRAIKWSQPPRGCGLNPTAPGGPLSPEASQLRQSENPGMSLAQAVAAEQNLLPNQQLEQIEENSRMPRGKPLDQIAREK